MKNMNEKTKKWLFIAGGLALSAVLVVAITGQFRTPPIQDVDIPPQSSSSQDVVVDTPDITEKEDGITVPPIQIPQESESANGVDKGTEQTIQPNTSEKPNYTEEELKNPEQKPNGDKVTENDKLQDHDKVEKPVTPPKTDNQPQGGMLIAKVKPISPDLVGLKTVVKIKVLLVKAMATSISKSASWENRIYQVKEMHCKSGAFFLCGKEFQ